MAYVEENQNPSAQARMDRCAGSGVPGTPPEVRAAAALCGAAVRGADSATTSGGEVRRSCRMEVRSAE